MNAELVLMGKRISMASRTRRRWLVVFIYVGLAGITGLCTLYYSFTSACVVVIATWFVNGFFLGGDYLGGLVKPFTGKPIESPILESIPGHLLKWGFHRATKPTENDIRSDEREVLLRDRAHYVAYKVIVFAIMFPLIAILDRKDGLHSLPASTVPLDRLLFNFFLVAWAIYATLPQAMLVWTEPDMEQDQA